MKKLPGTFVKLFGAVAIIALMAVSAYQFAFPSKSYAQDSEARARNTCNQLPLRADDSCPFLKDYVVPFINALSGAVGIVVVIMIVWGGIQYTSSRDNPQQAAQAKDHIRNAVFALVFYIFMIAFLNWAVPGGVF